MSGTGTLFLFFCSPTQISMVGWENSTAECSCSSRSFTDDERRDEENPVKPDLCSQEEWPSEAVAATELSHHLTIPVIPPKEIRALAKRGMHEGSLKKCSIRTAGELMPECGRRMGEPEGKQLSP